jgi:putative pre-16S rRNA nuclease
MRPSRRVLGVDIGRRRVGVAISDATGMLARPLRTLTVERRGDAVRQIAQLARELADDDDGLGAIVVGLPRHLDGSATPETAHAEAFAEALRREALVPVEFEDERLSSREAESRLAVREKDWRKRKAQLDAAAAAVILQDYLDRRERSARL